MKPFRGLGAAILVCACAWPVKGWAQDDEYYGSYAFEPGAEVRVFSDTVFLRDAPEGTIIDTLFGFQTVRIKERSSAPVYTVGRKSAPWYQVTAPAGDRGYIWGGALALDAVTRERTTFLFGLLSFPQAPANTGDGWNNAGGYNTCAVKARDAGGRVQSCYYNISRESLTFFRAGPEAAGGEEPPAERKTASLPPGTRFLVCYGMSGEACGIPNYQIAAAWDGTRLVRMPLLESNVDGGVWSYDEAYVFPEQEGGRPGHLLVRGTSVEYFEESGKEQEKKTVTTRRYRWDEGSGTFVPLK